MFNLQEATRYHNLSRRVSCDTLAPYLIRSLLVGEIYHWLPLRRVLWLRTTDKRIFVVTFDSLFSFFMHSCIVVISMNTINMVYYLFVNKIVLLISSIS
jgi:hypothetical protein